MAFGYMVVQRLLPLVRVISRLPDPVSRTFANILLRGHEAVPHHQLLRILRRGTGLQPAQNGRQTRPGHRRAATPAHPRERRRPARGMHFPPGWDPFFDDFMTLEDLYRYPGRHFDFHARQLTLTATQ